MLGKKRRYFYNTQGMNITIVKWVKCVFEEGAQIICGILVEWCTKLPCVGHFSQKTSAGQSAIYTRSVHYFARIFHAIYALGLNTYLPPRQFIKDIKLVFPFFVVKFIAVLEKIISKNVKFLKLGFFIFYISL